MNQVELKSILRAIFCFVIVIASSNVKSNDIITTITPIRISEKIDPDGNLTEDIWNTKPLIKSFWQYFPLDSITAKGSTEIMMAYDDQFLYVAGVCHSVGNDFVTSSLKRDYSYFGSDNITIMLDTYNDNTNAFVFGLNPFGVRREALVTGGGRGRGSFTMSWDNKWWGDSQQQEKSWTFEMAIPFSSLRYAEESTEWRLNVYRNDTQANEQSTWSRIPQNRIISDLTYMGKINWPDLPQKTSSNISVIPYISTSSARDFENPDETKANSNFAIGGDAKIGITSGLNLDLTFNPDFSQVEVDRQVTNLGRFEIFFPERRQFFLENADLFGGFGTSRSNPFFSRRIGVARDTATDLTIQKKINYGARLSGKIGENLRVGLLTMTTDKQTASGLPAFNYSVAAIQQKIGVRSNIGAIFVNKQAIKGESESDIYDTYNRVVGLDYNLLSEDNVWRGKAYFHYAITPEEVDDKYSTFMQLERTTRYSRFELVGMIVGQGFDAEVGFVPRKDFAMVSPEFELFFYPNGGIINRHNFNVDVGLIYQIGKNENAFVDPWELSEWQVESRWSFRFQDNSNLTLFSNTEKITLFNDFDPTRAQEDDVFLPAGEEYQYTNYGFSFRSDSRRKMSYNITPTLGNFFNGKRTSFRLNLSYRMTTLGTISMDVNYNRINLADPFEPVTLWLVGPRFDLTFSKSLFFTNFFQYNNQAQNFNINSRLQWRFAPVSDLFLVYTDNYFTDEAFSQFNSRNRAIVLKVSYWFNV
ncbi:MAG: carbohydrate binding family 9 domain-containing protein [Bacteroidia bacterium]|nr:carbohydrate binding family 9 domain-containing protein [Bacteroidia bacterium]